jgi:GntP family gluconate:H+ symporter
MAMSSNLLAAVPGTLLSAADPVPPTTTAPEWVLILAALIGIATIVVLITWVKLHPFLSLVIGALVTGLVAGMSATQTVLSFTNGFGSTAGGVGVLIALGAIYGKLLADSGGADRIVDTLISKASAAALPWVMGLVGALIGLPMFFEVGLVLLVPVIILVARRSGVSLMKIAIPTLAGLSAMHGLVPPHPGPLAAIGLIGANLGVTLAFGVLIAIPTVIIAGPVFARFATHWAHAAPPQDLIDQVAKETKNDNPPSFGLVLFTVLLPVAIMLSRTVVDVSFSEGDPIRDWADFIGDPIVALLIGVLVALWTFGFSRGVDRDTLNGYLGASLAPAASILLIIGAGGAFKQVLVDSGIGDAIGKGVDGIPVSALLIGWLVAVLIRLATGSATVATVTAAGIMASILKDQGGVDPALLALAIGCGSVFFSHVNDAGFWLVNQYFGMSVPDTLKTWSVMETIISVVGIILVMVLSLVV